MQIIKELGCHEDVIKYVKGVNKCWKGVNGSEEIDETTNHKARTLEKELNLRVLEGT